MFEKFKNDIRKDYDSGYSIEMIAERCINKLFCEKTRMKKCRLNARPIKKFVK